MIAVATGMLWYATMRLVKGADKTAERQLRAYVYIEKTNFEFTADGLFKVKYQIKNFGQTPAHNVSLLSIVQVVDWKHGNPSIPVPDRIETIGSMAPREDYFWFDDELDVATTREGTERGDKAIFLLGTIVYDVAFEMSARETNFRYYIGGDIGTDGDEMSAASIGNDAT